MYLKACTAYGLKEQDLFQVNDLYENKNLYMVVDNLFSLGGMVSYFQNVRDKKLIFWFSRLRRSPGRDLLWASKLPVRTRGTSMRTRWRRASPWSGCRWDTCSVHVYSWHNRFLLQYGTNKGASQAGMTPYGAGRQIRLEGELTSFVKLKSQALFLFSCSLDNHLSSYPILLLSTESETWLLSKT